MDLSNYLKEIKKTPGVIYLVSGDETILFQDLRINTKKIADLQHAEVVSFDLNEDPVDNFLVAVDNSSLFSTQRYLFVEHFFDSLNKQFSKKQLAFLSQRLSGTLPGVTLIFIEGNEKIDRRLKVNKLITTLGEKVELSKLKPGEVSANLKNYLKKRYNKPFSSEVINEILNRTNYDYTALRGELPKLTLFLDQHDSLLTLTEVKQLITPNIDHNIFDLIGNLSDKKFNEVMKQYKDLLSYFGQPYGLNGALINNFQLLLQVKILQQSGYDHYQMQKKLVGVHPYRIKLAQQKNQRFSLNQLIKVNRILLEMDQKIKTSSINYDQLFVDLILELKENS